MKPAQDALRLREGTKHHALWGNRRHPCNMAGMPELAGSERPAARSQIRPAIPQGRTSRRGERLVARKSRVADRPVRVSRDPACRAGLYIAEWDVPQPPGAEPVVVSEL